MGSKGYFIVYQDNDDLRDIHYQQIKLRLGQDIPEDQLELRDQVDKTLTVLKMIFEDDDKKYFTYFRQLLSLSQLGLVGNSANPKLAMRALNTMKDDILSLEGGKVKNIYMLQLGKAALKLSILPFALFFIVLYFGFSSTIPYYLCSIIGSLLGVWLSFGIRKIYLKFEDLNILEKDRLNPYLRLFFSVALTIVICLLITTQAAVFEIGGLSTKNYLSKYEISFLVGVFCGISEKALSIKVGQQAAEFLGLKTL
ncbi:MAG: hypothetical protein CVV44_20180 [Spirochaetae bacterium HGW-Spirochaetae-1]|jgi:hypothetical protein|nr:MAG: hypothetical protein CVV44_20180 [Spirochaetae bacterium HGW-Spirochaetae-1]